MADYTVKKNWKSEKTNAKGHIQAQHAAPAYAARQMANAKN